MNIYLFCALILLYKLLANDSCCHQWIILLWRRTREMMDTRITQKWLKTRGCVLRNLAIYALVLENSTISIHSSHYILIVLYIFCNSTVTCNTIRTSYYTLKTLRGRLRGKLSNSVTTRGSGTWMQPNRQSIPFKHVSKHPLPWASVHWLVQCTLAG